MIELIIVLIIVLILFVFILLEFIKKRTKKNLIILIFDIIFILAYLIHYLVHKEHSNILRVFVSIFSLILPIINLIIDKLEYSYKEAFTLLLVEILLFLGNNRLAKKIIYNFLKTKPHSFPLHKKLGDIFKKEGGLRKALNEYIIAINLKQDLPMYLEVTNMFYELGNIEEARDGLIYILNKEPDFLEGHMFLSEIYLELEKYKEAVNSLNNALKCLKDKGSFDIYFKLGEIYAKLNDFKSSKESFQKAYDINPKDVLLFYIAQIDLIENEEEKAIENLKEILENRILKPYVLYELAKIAVYREESSKAVSYINEAIKLEESLKDRALNDYIFSNIKNEFVLSVKLDEEEIETIKEKMIDQKADKKIMKNILLNLKSHQKDKPNILEKFKLVEQVDEELTENEIEIMKHFSNISSTITNMGDITSQQKTKTIVDRIFKQKLGQIEVQNHILNEQLEELEKQEELN